MPRRIEEHYAEAAAQVRSELVAIRDHLREVHGSMSATAFASHLDRIGMDEAAALDFLASDGTIEGMTDRMWVYFESPLKPRRVSSA